jgi:predicted S18 family serine protease
VGYYLEVSEDKNKSDQLKRLYGAKEIEPVKSLNEVPEGKALVVVVENEHFDAAGYIYNKNELEAASYDSYGKVQRKRTWLLIDKEKVLQNILDNHGIDLRKKPSRARKYYCNLCDLECHDELTYSQHVKSIEHLKKSF